MTPLDTPELLHLVCTHLTAHDLTQCLRVNRTWHAAAIPFVWRSITSTPNVRSKHQLLFRLIQQDFLRVQQLQKDGKQGLPSVLSKYGQWIKDISLTPDSFADVAHTPRKALFLRQKLQNYQMMTQHIEFPLHQQIIQLQQLLQHETDPYKQELLRDRIRMIRRAQQPPNCQSKDKSTAQDLLLHLLKHCCNLQTLSLSGWPVTKSEDALWKSIATDMVPRLQGLSIICNSEFGDVRIQMLKPVLDQCSAKLQRLSFCVRCNSTIHAQDEEEQEEEEGEETGTGELLVGLKEMDFSLNTLSSFFKQHFTKRCIQVEELRVDSVDIVIAESLKTFSRLKKLHINNFDNVSARLISSALPHLPNLDTFHADSEDSQHFVKDRQLADLLSASRLGWRSIRLLSLNTLAAGVLISKHCPTLEELVLEQSLDMSSTQMRQILSSSPRLHTFVTLLQGGLTESKVPHFMPKVPHFVAKDFIDLDSASDTLKPWKCESSLRVFHAKILGIPRSDVTTDRRGFPREDVLQETYPGQTQELQSRVYERLARFTRLEKLGLGHDNRDLHTILLDSIHNIDGDHVFGDDDHQYDCLEMTLKSGLGILEVLKKLKELNVMRMTTRIGVDEVKWMRRNWPSLQTIIGLDIRGNEMDAVQWLQEECPQVKLTAYTMD